jgi:DUF2950 family protein
MMLRITACLILGGMALLSAETAGPKTFSTPEEARDALVQSAAKGWDAVREIFGPGSAKILHSGDQVQDKILLDNFKRRASEKTQLEPDELDVNRMTLVIGEEEWPFAMPLVRKNGRWYFDIQEGEAEIHRRIIGGNELDAIEVCQGYVEAQLRYAEVDRDGNGVPEYARRIVSTPGKRDGLYWPGDDSPVAERFAKAVAEGYTANSGPPKPYHGYLYKILTGQGPNAAGGARDYLVHNLMIGGFALIAWPVEYGVSGIKTFLVNQDGLVFEKDLGPRTGALANATKTFNPDQTWDLAPQVISGADSQADK